MDLIERQAALDILDGLQIAHEQGMDGAYEDYRKQMCELPSAQELSNNSTKLDSGNGELLRMWGRHERRAT